MTSARRNLYLFGGLNLLQGALVGAVPLLVPAREPTINWVLGTAAVVMLIAGPALALGGRPGRVVAASACLLHWIIGALGTALVLASASYLLGIYGRHGSAAGSIAVVMSVVVLVLFWLIPLHELAFLRRLGRER